MKKYILFGLAIMFLIYLIGGKKAALAYWTIPGLPPPP